MKHPVRIFDAPVFSRPGAGFIGVLGLVVLPLSRMRARVRLGSGSIPAGALRLRGAVCLYKCFAAWHQLAMKIMRFVLGSVDCDFADILGVFQICWWSHKISGT